MSFNKSDIWLQVKVEITYNKILLVYGVVLSLIVLFIVRSSITLFELKEPIRIISPSIIIVVFTISLWGNRIKENRDRLIVLLPIAAVNQSIGRFLTYLIILAMLFIPHFILSEMGYKGMINITSDAYNDFGIIVTILGLSFITQDFRFVIKSKYEKLWIVFSILLIVVLATPPLLFLDNHSLDLIGNINPAIKQLYIRCYGLILIGLSGFLFYKRKTYTQ